jgi:hypothetical protein
MLTKLKLALALTATLAAGAAGFAAANTGTAAADDAGVGWKQKLLEKYDTNGNGQLDPSERAQMRADMKAKRQERRQEMLAKYDLNKDGKLEPDERRLMLEDRAAKRFDKLDVNGDGVLTKQEFTAGFVKAGMRHRHHRFFKGGHRGQGQGVASPDGPSAPTGTGAVTPDAP